MFESENIVIDRRKLVIKPNALVCFNGKKYKISNVTPISTFN